jgi:hypothetical protein
MKIKHPSIKTKRDVRNKIYDMLAAELYDQPQIVAIDRLGDHDIVVDVKSNPTIPSAPVETYVLRVSKPRTEV